MEYYDQKIIKEKNAQKKPNIYEDEVFIHGVAYKFTNQSLYSDVFSIMLPETFIDMPEQFAKVKYPMEQKPSCIKTNADTSINFAFNFIPQEVKDEQLADMISQFRDGLRKMYPTTRFYDAKVIEQVLSETENASCIMEVGEEVPIGSPIIQYQETDWEFIRRLASHFQTSIYPEYTMGLPQGCASSLVATTGYTAHISSKYYELEGAAAGYSRSDF